MITDQIKRYLPYLQYILPKHWLSIIAGAIARLHYPWIKNRLIQSFIKQYDIDISDALIDQVEQYPNLNHFFTRKLKSESRPITQKSNGIASPVDGTIMYMGCLDQNQLLQAKHGYFSLASLLGGDAALAQTFDGGQGAIFYLAPRDYHRVHMPISGHIIRTSFIPGKLFAVNRITTEIIPNIYSQNERLIILCRTSTTQKMVIILIGALMVGSIQLAWEPYPIQSNHYQVTRLNPPVWLNRGEEVGCFHFGSTVILLYPPHTMSWIDQHQYNTHLLMGELVGYIHPATTL